MGLTSASNVWIGAWWIGFVFAALACVLLAIPLFGYPKTLPGAEKLQQEKISEAYNADTQKTEQSCTKLKELPRALIVLLRNPTFFFLNLAGASEGLVIAGFAAFLPKQIENQFSISPVWSALLMGLITVPAGGGGTFLGGYLVKRYKLACAGIIKMCLLATAIATCFTTCLLLSCPNLDFAGVSKPYHVLSSEQGTFDHNMSTVYTPNWNGSFAHPSLSAACNANCSCRSSNYNPICGIDGVMYYSPCYAGCTAERTMDDAKTFSNCSCILQITSALEHDVAATNTMCASACRRLPYFVAFCFVLMFFTFLATMPALSATLRCVHDEQRSFGLGIQWIKVRLLGTIPAPMIFGALIDETCILWQQTGDDLAGACLVYDNRYMSRYMWLLALVSKMCSVLFFFGAWWFYIPPKQNDGQSLNSEYNVNNSTAATTTLASVDADVE